MRHFRRHGAIGSDRELQAEHPRPAMPPMDPTHRRLGTQDEIQGQRGGGIAELLHLHVADGDGDLQRPTPTTVLPPHDMARFTIDSSLQALF